MVKMEKIRKLFIICCISLLTITPFNCVFADEDILDPNIDESLVDDEIIDNNDSNVNNGPIIIDNSEQLNDIEFSLSHIMTSLNSVTNPRTLINAVDFSNFTSSQILYLYDHYNDYELIYGDSVNYGGSLIFSNDVISYDDVTEPNYIFSCISKTIVRPNGDVVQNNIRYDLFTTGGTTVYRLIRNINTHYDYFNLNPFKLSIVNNGSGLISNSITIDPYLTTSIYFFGQSITLTYDNADNDFVGWFVNGKLVSDSLSYTFTITTDTNISLNLPFTPVTDDNYVILLTCIFICLLFILFKSLIWGV